MSLINKLKTGVVGELLWYKRTCCYRKINVRGLCYIEHILYFILSLIWNQLLCVIHRLLLSHFPHIYGHKVKSP